MSRLDFAIRKKGYTQEEVEAVVKAPLVNLDEKELKNVLQSVNSWSQKVA